MRLYDAMPARGVSRVLREQIVRSGTSVGAHYREATRGRSHAEFAAKLNAGLMELGETAYWLELTEGAGVFTERQLSLLKDETYQLTAILVTMIKRSKE
jgi:four helix bundle protein